MFKDREGINRRNHGHSSLPLDGTSGIWRTRLAPGWHWDLGEPGSPRRGVVKDTRLGSGATIQACTRGDWYGALGLHGSVEVAGRTLVRDDVLIAERGSAIPDIVAGDDGAHLLENFRTARAL